MDALRDWGDAMTNRDGQPTLVGLVPPLWSKAVAEQLAQHRGRWVAIRDDRIVAVADTLPEVSAAAEAQGFDRPIVFRVPWNPGRVVTRRPIPEHDEGSQATSRG